ncbi:unnamed protein product, partial [Didymodactylos carnosus]
MEQVLASSDCSQTTDTFTEICDAELTETLIIWFDRSIQPSNKTIQRFSSTNKFFRFYNQRQTFLKQLKTSTINKKIYLIVSGPQKSSIINDVHEFDEINSIFIRCKNRCKHETLMEKYWKIVGIFTDQEILEENLKIMTEQSDDIKHQKLIHYVTEEPDAFLWLLLLKEMVLSMPSTLKAKQYLVNKCRQSRRLNADGFRALYEFEQYYNYRGQPLTWYKEFQPFINKLFSNDPIESLNIFRYYLKDLCRCLTNESFKQNQHEQIIKIYRSMTILNSEIQHLRINIDNLILFNGFLSGFTSRKFAIKSIKKYSKRVDEHMVLFEIHLDTHMKKINVVSIATFPKYDEVLFDMYTIFKIITIVSNSELTVISMTITDEQILFASDPPSTSSLKAGQMFARLIHENADISVYFQHLFNIHGNQQTAARIYYKDKIVET